MVFLLAFCKCEQPVNEHIDDRQDSTLNAFEQNAKLGRSINLGNILEAPNEGEWGLVLEESYFSLIAEAGFTGVRLPCKWSAHTTESKPYTIDPDFLARVDWAIDQAEANNLAIVVNVHHYNEYNEDPQGQKARLTAIWKQLAHNFISRSNDLILELYNEPNENFTPELWNTVLNDLIDTIRVIDPKRTLMVGTANWGGIGGLDDLDLPADSNLIVTVHYYNPFQFTHQGAEWVAGAEEWLGTTWGIESTDHDALRADFEAVKQWSDNHTRPIFVGEFGAYNKAEMVYRRQWTWSAVNVMEELGFSWAYWEFGAGFGAYDIVNEEWNDLLSALIQD